MSAYKNVSRNIYYKDYTFISDANSLPRSAVLNRSQQTYSTRVRKILLANKTKVNTPNETKTSLIDDSSSSSSASSHSIPLNETNSFNNNIHSYHNSYENNLLLNNQQQNLYQTNNFPK